jgi:hypothetical protein
VSEKTVVLKFGSSVLRSAGDLHLAIDEIYRHWRSRVRVLAVVSATPHYVNYPTILARLSRIRSDALKDLLFTAWSFAHLKPGKHAAR